MEELFINIDNLILCCKSLADEVNNQPEIEMAPNQRVLRAVVRAEHTISVIRYTLVICCKWSLHSYYMKYIYSLLRVLTEDSLNIFFVRVLTEDSLNIFLVIFYHTMCYVTYNNSRLSIFRIAALYLIG